MFPKSLVDYFKEPKSQRLLGISPEPLRRAWGQGNGWGWGHTLFYTTIVDSFLIFLFLFWCRAVCVLSDCLPLGYIARPHYFLFKCFQIALNI